MAVQRASISTLHRDSASCFTECDFGIGLIFGALWDEQLGYDNWRILRINDYDSVAVYISASLDGLKKKVVRKTVKLPNVNSVIETKQANMWFDFAL